MVRQMKYSCFKKTQDNWCGNYYNELVKLTFHGNITPYREIPTYRVSVWGNDNMGMEFDTKNERTAHFIFQQVIGLEYVNKTDLIKLNFVSS